jgi:beta-phosphoglucomutase-like phosphatase (HAD superfamily)
LIQCLLFDCDGTLVDSERLCNIGLVIKFRELNITLDADELELRFKGQKLANILQQLQAEHAVSIPDDFVGTCRKMTNNILAKELKPIAGIANVLDQLEHPKAVGSSAPRDRIYLALKVCGLTRYFNGNIYSTYEIGFWKPDPKLYEFAAQHMGYSRRHAPLLRTR